MGRRNKEERHKTARLDFSDLDINDVLLEDLHKYVGSPKEYIPKLWDICVRVLREENRIILTQRRNGETLDQLYTDFYNAFSENKFRRVVRDHGLSVRLDGFRDNVTDFLYDMFIILYPQVAATVDKLTRNQNCDNLLNYIVEVEFVEYDNYNNGFGVSERAIAVSVIIKPENRLSTKLLSSNGYDF